MCRRRSKPVLAYHIKRHVRRAHRASNMMFFRTFTAKLHWTAVLTAEFRGGLVLLAVVVWGRCCWRSLLFLLAHRREQALERLENLSGHDGAGHGQSVDCLDSAWNPSASKQLGEIYTPIFLHTSSTLAGPLPLFPSPATLPLYAPSFHQAGDGFHHRNRFLNVRPAPFCSKQRKPNSFLQGLRRPC